MNRHQAYTVSEFDKTQREGLEAIKRAFTILNGREINEEEMNGVLYFLTSASETDRAAEAFVVVMKSAYERGYRARADEDYARAKALLAEQQAE